MISPPPVKTPIALIDANKQIDTQPSWVEFLSDVYYGIKYTQTSGTTAQRPTKDLFAGRFYFDASLGANGRPIWIAKDGSTWIDSTGTPV